MSEYRDIWLMILGAAILKLLQILGRWASEAEATIKKKIKIDKNEKNALFDAVFVIMNDGYSSEDGFKSYEIIDYTPEDLCGDFENWRGPYSSKKLRKKYPPEKVLNSNFDFDLLHKYFPPKGLHPFFEQHLRQKKRKAKLAKILEAVRRPLKETEQ